MYYLRLVPVLATLFLALMSPRAVHAATYYVSSAGSATGSCTSTSSTCTFNRAQSLSTAGDVISIQGKIGAINITKAGLTISGGIVDGSNLTTSDSAAILISANNTTLDGIEITNGWAYGFRTISNISNVTAKKLNIHHNVRENFNSSTGGCVTNRDGGWGSAMRAYFTNTLYMSDSYIWENCGEGFSAVMSKNIHGERLTLWDNWSVNVYPDQTDTYSFKNSTIYCIKPEFQRFTRNRSFTLGAEDSYGPTTNITKNITLTNNQIYNCRGLSSYSQTTGGFENVTVTNNTFSNSYDAAIGSIPGTNIVTSPNIVNTINPVPTPTIVPISSISPSPKPWTNLENDYSIWSTNYLKSISGFISGDFSENGIVDGVDYVLWLLNYAK